MSRSPTSPQPAVHSPSRTQGRHPDDATVVDLLDRLLDRGVVVEGDVVLSLAGVDLLYVGLRLVVKTPDETTPP